MTANEKKGEFEARDHGDEPDPHASENCTEHPYGHASAVVYVSPPSSPLTVHTVSSKTTPAAAARTARTPSVKAEEEESVCACGCNDAVD